MASTRAQNWWEAQGYRSEPGVPVTAPGRTGEALLAADTAEAQINATQEVPEVYSPTASSLSGHHAGPRTLSASYYPVSHVLQISFAATSPASGGTYSYMYVSEDEWRAFQSAASSGRYINSVLNYHRYGQAAAPAAQATVTDDE